MWNENTKIFLPQYIVYLLWCGVMQWVSTYLFSGDDQRVVHVTWQMRAFSFNVCCSGIEGALRNATVPRWGHFSLMPRRDFVEKPLKTCEFISVQKYSFHTSWREAAHHLQVLLSKAIMPWRAGSLFGFQKPPAICNRPAAYSWDVMTDNPQCEMGAKSCLSRKVCGFDRIRVREGMLCQMRSARVQVVWLLEIKADDPFWINDKENILNKNKNKGI